ncbi:MAG TPA: peptide-methionine (S)-S-oxide reductase [Flavobacteriia bacterium]|nr:peptide-methionine (S)-S-oxide reductase [Flavobacteriia bacterium]
MKKIILFLLLLGLVTFNLTDKKKNMKQQNNVAYATFGGGCFWCTEAIFSELKGVKSVESGYAGGTTKNPSYREVCTGNTGHAEVIHITYDPEEISYEELLDVFFATHDPTTLNRQGADVGTQYRSVIFYHDEAQKQKALDFIKSLEKEHIFDDKIVTEVVPFTNYYKAEDYHQDYFNNNKSQGYCNAVINPKLIKFRKKFKEKLKSK